MSTETVVDESFDYEIDKFSGEVLFPRIAILKLCKELHVRCMAHPVIAEPGYGRIQFDFGVYKSRKELAFLIEYDGPAHYDVDITDRFMISYGLLASTKKAKVLSLVNIPILYVNPLSMRIFPDILRAWIWQFIDDYKIKNKYISMVLMYDKYGWTFEHDFRGYENERVKLFLGLRNEFIEKNGKIDSQNWYDFYKIIKPFKF